MKKSIVIIFVAALAVLCLVFACTSQSASANADFLRIHIRADSNSSSDQSVKYVVKQAVVEFLTPSLANATTKAEAMRIAQSKLSQLKQICDQTLAAQGKTYKSTVRLCREDFPDRVYNGVTLSAGVYDALIIELGSGSGDNWWCVVYPPLCFVGESNGTQNIVYRSRLLEIIRQWRESH